MNTITKIATIDNEIEAQLLEAELKSRQIPHVLVSYHDLLFDGAFQLSRGWGHVEAPVEYEAKILGILRDLRKADNDTDFDR